MLHHYPVHQLCDARVQLRTVVTLDISDQRLDVFCQSVIDGINSGYLVSIFQLLSPKCQQVRIHDLQLLFKLVLVIDNIGYACVTLLGQLSDGPLSLNQLALELLNSLLEIGLKASYQFLVFLLGSTQPRDL